VERIDAIRLALSTVITGNLIGNESLAEAMHVPKRLFDDKFDVYKAALVYPKLHFLFYYLLTKIDEPPQEGLHPFELVYTL